MQKKKNRNRRNYLSVKKDIQNGSKEIKWGTIFSLFLIQSKGLLECQIHWYIDVTNYFSCKDFAIRTRLVSQGKSALQTSLNILFAKNIPEYTFILYLNTQTDYSCVANELFLYSSLSLSLSLNTLVFDFWL